MKMFILVAMAGIFMIASSFNMSILERTQFFGLLRCLGATREQVRRLITTETKLLDLQQHNGEVRTEAATYAVTGSIVGGILGVILHRFFFGMLISSNWGADLGASSCGLVCYHYSSYSYNVYCRHLTNGEN